MIDLGEAYPGDSAAAGRVFRARKLAIAPGARINDVSASERPAIYYVTAGEIVETRGGVSTKKSLHSAGAVGANTPVVLEHASASPAEILLVDVTTQP